jgi:ubiquinone/menaquinone biosynthesis C-methylase UbiE
VGVQGKSVKDNRSYYDAFSERYERGRDAGYHALVDALTVDLVRRHARGKDVLEVGCGTGLILKEVARDARRASGADLSGGMLRRARERGLRVAQADATAIPFASESFDVVCAFKVLPHVRDLKAALAEMARVLRPGGHLLAEFYNRRSLRYLLKRLKSPTPIAEGVRDDEVFTRYDTLGSFAASLPAGLRVVGTRGIRIVTPAAGVHAIPGVRGVFGALERALCDSPFRSLAGFVTVVARKEG